MASSLILPEGELSRAQAYEALLPQMRYLLEGESNLIANMANVAAALKEVFGFFWVGFYLVDSEEELVLGPFQGPIACTRLKKGKGVCGTCWQQQKSLCVPDVDAFPGHVACSSASRSEIVVPIMDKERVIAILDIDSDQLNDFSEEVDAHYLEQLMQLLSPA